MSNTQDNLDFTPVMKFSEDIVPKDKDNTTKNKIAIPVGGLLDYSTGNIVKGPKGDYFINGGLQRFTAITGSTNNYKTTLAHHYSIKALERIMESGYPSYISTHDAEITMETSRLEALAEHYAPWVRNPISREKPIWYVTDANTLTGNEWEKKFTKDMEDASKSDKTIIEFTGHIDPYTGKCVKDQMPTIGQLDTLSKLRPNKVYEKLDDEDLDSKDTNTVFMNEGMFKKKMLISFPRKLAMANRYMVVTAHISEKIEIASGPSAYMKPSRQLQFLKAGDSLKGVTSELRESVGLMLQAHTATKLNNKVTKAAEYPDGPDDEIEVDMNKINLTVVRNKLKTTGITIPIIVTQEEGFIPYLTEFDFIKTLGRWGLTGNKVNYELALYPGVKLSRTTVRRKLKENYKLRKALTFTAEMLQIQLFHRKLAIELGIDKLTPEAVYEGITSKFDWDLIWPSRSYPLIDHYGKHTRPPLSTVDLMRMAIGTYVPYWYPKDKVKK